MLALTIFRKYEKDGYVVLHSTTIKDTNVTVMYNPRTRKKLTIYDRGGLLTIKSTIT